jgi:hypothetical protein
MKRPKVAKEPSPKQSPKVAPNSQAKAPNFIQMRGGALTWRFSTADRGGPFAWPTLEDASSYKSVSERLHQFETMTEADIAQSGSHAVEISSLSKDARDRLTQIKLDDLDELFSFRIDGPTRVWCRPLGSLMLVLWWDPEHLVCPSNKKHT